MIEFEEAKKAYRDVCQHPGIQIRCEGDDAAEVWNRLAGLLELRPMIEFEEARKECDRTYRPNKIPPRRPEDFPCFLPEYLAARRRYHALMVKAGMLDPRAAET